MALFRALRIRTFALLWVGQSISRVGDFLFQVALAWWVLEKTGSATVMGTVLIATMAPMLVFLLLGGVAGDRLPRIPMMLASDLGRGIIQAVVALLAFSALLEVWHVYLAGLLFGLTDAFFQPAYAALVPEIVPAADLPSANSLTSLSTQAARVVGPALGAAIIAAGGTAAAFAIDAASFFVSTACLVPLVWWGGTRPVVAAAESRSSILRDVGEGFRTVLASPWLWITLCVLAVTNMMLAGPYSVALPFLIDEQYGGDVNLLGLLYAVFPIGYVLGGIWLGRMRHIRRRGMLAHGGLIVAGLGMLIIGLPIPFPLKLVAALCNGAGLEVLNLIWYNSMPELVPNDRLGRVSSIDLLVSYALLPVGYALAGWTTNAFGAATACILGGGITIVAASLSLVHPAIRGLD